MARRLLFERLTADEGTIHGVRPGGNRAEGARREPDPVKASVALELERLLNTRAPLPVDRLGRRRTTIDYGIPDLSAFGLPGADAAAALCRQIEQAILAFEPRLSAPRATLVSPAGRHDRYEVEIAGMLVIGGEMEPVGFRLPIGDERPERDDR